MSESALAVYLVTGIVVNLKAIYSFNYELTGADVLIAILFCWAWPVSGLFALLRFLAKVKIL